jgi:tRNA acetyltransferase TAN1
MDECNYNLLIGCPRDRERAAHSEARYFVGDLLEDGELQISRTHISGLLACRTNLDPFEVVHKLKKFALENPYQFRFAIRFTPLQACVPSEITRIIDVVQELCKQISETESFRVTVRKRHTELRTMEVIEQVAAVVLRTVNLDNPDKIIWIEIVGSWTGISVLNEEQDILSIMTMRNDQY